MRIKGAYVDDLVAYESRLSIILPAAAVDRATS